VEDDPDMDGGLGSQELMLIILMLLFFWWWLF